MSDLIDRQAAIDEFDGVKVDEENCTEYDIGFNDGVDLAISKLSVLTSAQPTPCDVCRHNPPSSMDGKPCCICPAERGEG